MNILLLDIVNEPETPIMAIAIWVVILLLVFFCRKMIGRTLFGLAFGILMLFFIIFMVDNYTGHNLRNWVNINFYDTTLENPSGVASDIVDKVSKGGQDINSKINEVGSELDESLNIEREGTSNKVWKEKKEPSKEEVTSQETTKKGKKKDKKTNSPDNYIIISYKDIDTVLKNQLADLDKDDKKLLKSISPTFKTTLKGNQITITNDDKELLENNQLKISVN